MSIYNCCWAVKGNIEMINPGFLFENWNRGEDVSVQSVSQQFRRRYSLLPSGAGAAVRVCFVSRERSYLPHILPHTALSTFRKNIFPFRIDVWAFSPHSHVLQPHLLLCHVLLPLRLHNRQHHPDHLHPLPRQGTQIWGWHWESLHGTLSSFQYFTVRSHLS